MRHLLGALLALLPGVAAGQAWTRDAGHGYVNTSLSHISGDRLYDKDGETRDLPTTYAQTSVGLYGEVGLIDRWLTLSLDGEMYRHNELEDQGATQGIGDLRVGAWSGVVVAPIRVTVGATVKLPTGDPSPDAEGVDAVDRPGARLIARSLPTGEGAVVVEPALRLGTTFGGGAWPLRHFFEAGAGYQARVDGADALTWRAKIGVQWPISVLDRVWFVFAVDAQHSLADDADLLSASATGLGEGVTYVSPIYQLHVRVWQGLGVFGSYAGAFQAKRIIAAPSKQVGLSYDF